MGLLDIIGKIFSGVLKEAENRVSEVDKAQYRSRNLSDKTVFEKMQNSSGLEKMGYANELKDRGVIEKDENGKYQVNKKRK